MTPLDLSAALAAEHRRDLRAAAGRARLAALARGCRPAAWRRALGRAGALRTWAARDHLGRLDTCTCR